MRKALYGLCVAFLTFALGVLVYLTTLKPVAQSVPASKPVESRASEPAVKTPAAPPVPGNLSVILRTSSIDEEPGYGYRTLKLSAKPVVVEDLDIMEEVDGEEITVTGGDQSAQFRIFERYRTSMTVMAEGPHLDLVDWRHYDSEWIPLNQLDQRKFQTLAGERMDYEKFPAVTKAELMAAVRKRAGDWPEAIDIAKACPGPNDYPCGVGVSSVYFRIEMLVGDQWTQVGVVEVLISMGC